MIRLHLTNDRKVHGTWRNKSIRRRSQSWIQATVPANHRMKLSKWEKWKKVNVSQISYFGRSIFVAHPIAPANFEKCLFDNVSHQGQRRKHSPEYGPWCLGLCCKRTKAESITNTFHPHHTHRNLLKGIWAEGETSIHRRRRNFRRIQIEFTVRQAIARLNSQRCIPIPIGCGWIVNWLILNGTDDSIHSANRTWSIVEHMVRHTATQFENNFTATFGHAIHIRIPVHHIHFSLFGHQTLSHGNRQRTYIVCAVRILRCDS